MQRAGGKNRPFYRVVAADSRAARDGRFLEKLGFYNPLRDPAEIELNVGRIEEWVSKGALLSEAVTQLLRNYEKRSQHETPEETKADA
jgi:small subunit ribosomal protein S16